MTTGPALRLRMGRTVTPSVERRIEYAFRTFCAVYELKPEVTCEGAADRPPAHRGIAYGCSAVDREVELPSVYDGRSPLEPAPPPQSIDRRPVFHAAGGRVDWLGEIFEWISSADDMAVRGRDSVGRIPFEDSIHGRYQIDPLVPHASVAMDQLARAIGVVPPPHPTLVGASHDLDYLTLGFRGDLKRTIKNVGVALLSDRDPRLALEILGAILRLLITRKTPLDHVDELCSEEERRGIRSTFNAIVKHASRRDADYDIRDPSVEATLSAIDGTGREVALHGSYTSLEKQSLGEEVATLRAFGFAVAGVRQHWLRYAGDALFEAVAEAGLRYDSTVGFSDRVGFRSGASFAYRPYDFRNERAYPFFELPLVVMDGALYVDARRRGETPEKLARRVMDAVDAFPSGSVSVLWHNTAFDGAQLPRAIGRVYWALHKLGSRWLPCVHVVREVASRFDAAFLEEVPA